MYFFIKSIILFYCVVLQTAKIAKKKCLENDFDLPTLFLNQISRLDRGLCFFKNGGYTV